MRARTPCRRPCSGREFHAARLRLAGGRAGLGYEKFVLDADQLGVLHSLAEGSISARNGQAMEAIREVGGHGTIRLRPYQANFKTAFWRTELLDYRPFEAWAEAGAPDPDGAGQCEGPKLLADHEAPGLDEGTAEALRDYVARRKASEPDAFG